MIIEKGELIERSLTAALIVWTVAGTLAFVALCGWAAYAAIHDTLYPPPPSEKAPD
jgi:hypothetical protein